MEIIAGRFPCTQLRALNDTHLLEAPGHLGDRDGQHRLLGHHLPQEGHGDEAREARLQERQDGHGVVALEGFHCAGLLEQLHPQHAVPGVLAGGAFQNAKMFDSDLRNVTSPFLIMRSVDVQQISICWGGSEHRRVFLFISVAVGLNIAPHSVWDDVRDKSFK